MNPLSALRSWLRTGFWMILFILCHLSCQAGTVAVSVPIPPLKWLAEQVGEGLVSCQVLVRGGQEPHTFAPTPKQMAVLFRSRLYFSLGMPFDRQLAARIRQAAPAIRVIDLTAGLKKLSLDGNQETGVDPHVWLSPPNLAGMAEVMASALAETDPAHRDDYLANLEKTRSLLAGLHRRIGSLLAPCSGRSIYVFHPAFGYFTHTYGLRQQPVEQDGKPPAPGRLATLVAAMKKNKVQVLFVQPQFDRKTIQTLARAIKGTVVPLDPLAEDVAGNLLAMAETIHAALCAK